MIHRNIFISAALARSDGPAHGPGSYLTGIAAVSHF